MDTHADELKLALHMVAEARREIMAYFRTDLTIEKKRDDTPVTIADRKAEERMRAIIERETPGYGIIGEEFGNQNEGHARRWVIDPIDGTKSFICGVPLFGTLLALMENGKPIVGVIDLPALGHTLSASEGGGAFVDGTRAQVSGIDQLEEAVLLDGCTTTMEVLGFAEPWQRLRRRAKMARGWGDCYGHFLVATGRAEVMVDPVAAVWDVAPLGIILPEAGGRFSSLAGTASVFDNSGISTNGRLHDGVLGEFAPYLKQTSH
jgi:myo-inositol-1(or 4)-monophosphatase